MDENRLAAFEKVAKVYGMQPPADVLNNPAMGSHSVQPECSRSSSFNSSSISRAKMVNLLKDKEKECDAVKTGPLRLLDLPMDVLKDIIKEVTHTNDLTSLALTHSAFHNLAIPHIYSRFDIVWPDAHSSSEPRSGVDALTYGLATLVMREDLFGYVLPQHNRQNRNSCVKYTCNHCGLINDVNATSTTIMEQGRRPRRGNLFSQYTRKFSLGNGPPDWVQEYLITKEAGKMLGTLVALTLARMPNLETFIWDMPTGILRDVWQSLADTFDGHRSRLEKVWIRFHDNKEIIASAASVPGSNTTAHPLNSAGVPSTLSPYPNTGTGAASPLSPMDLSYQNTECPSFSVLPPLQSLTVLEIDEPAYLAEISVLMRRSLKSLRELRVGISASSLLVTRTSSSTQQSYGQPNMEFLTEGGALGLIMSKLYDCRTPPSRSGLQDKHDMKPSSTSPSSLVEQPMDQPPTLAMSASSIGEDPHLAIPASIKLPDSPEEDVGYAEIVSSSLPRRSPSTIDLRATPAPSLVPQAAGSGQPIADPQKDSGRDARHERRENVIPETENHSDIIKSVQGQRLTLEVLELEKMEMVVPVLQHSVDWSVLTSLSLLQCSGHEQLWKFLRRTYSPRSGSTFHLQSSTGYSSQMQTRRRTPLNFGLVVEPEYRLNLKKIHTDAVSPALVAFLKETLAPNSLEWMILQDRGSYISPVSIDAIYRGPLRYHRSSLKKVSIDGSEKAPDNRTRSSKWKKWCLNRDILGFITSGKMTSLRELGMTVDYKDWHFFLQRLPNIPHLRSLYVPHIADHSYAHHLDAKDLASQVVNLVIALRPEIELCYMGILTKCFEILENRNHDGSDFFHDSRTNPAHAGPGAVGNTDEESDGTDDDREDDDDDDDSDNSPPAPSGAPNDAEETDSDGGEDSDGDDSDDEAPEQGNGKSKFKLREILFYDDKITIFKARHGRL